MEGDAAYDDASETELTINFYSSHFDLSPLSCGGAHVVQLSTSDCLKLGNLLWRAVVLRDGPVKKLPGVDIRGDLHGDVLEKMLNKIQPVETPEAIQQAVKKKKKTSGGVGGGGGGGGSSSSSPSKKSA